MSALSLNVKTCRYHHILLYQVSKCTSHYHGCSCGRCSKIQNKGCLENSADPDGTASEQISIMNTNQFNRTPKTSMSTETPKKFNHHWSTPYHQVHWNFPNHQVHWNTPNHQFHLEFETPQTTIPLKCLKAPCPHQHPKPPAPLKCLKSPNLIGTQFTETLKPTQSIDFDIQTHLSTATPKPLISLKYMCKPQRALKNS